MRRDAPTIQPFESLGDALRLMQLSRLRHLLVTSGDLLLGVVSHRDIRDLLIQGPRGAQARLLRDVPVEAVMCAPPVTVGPEVPVTEAAQRARHLAIGCLPVVREEPSGARLVGVVTASDLLRAAFEPRS